MRIPCVIGLSCFLPLVGFAEDTAPPAPTTCTYQTWDWNVKRKRSEHHTRVQKPYAEITPVERDEGTGCTVCEEDQVWVRLEGIPAFQICKRYEKEVSDAMLAVQKSGYAIQSVVTYRVGKTKGDPDKSGYRTQFSRHSFGIALDLNSEINGLYTNCFHWGPSCKLLRGGKWSPTQKGSLTAESPSVQAFKSIGWKWGGELEGRQKDFMHFSVYGD